MFHAVGSVVEEQVVDDRYVYKVHHVGDLGQRLEDSPREELVDKAQVDAKQNVEKISRSSEALYAIQCDQAHGHGPGIVAQHGVHT